MEALASILCTLLHRAALALLEILCYDFPCNRSLTGLVLSRPMFLYTWLKPQETGAVSATADNQSLQTFSSASVADGLRLDRRIKPSNAAEVLIIDFNYQYVNFFLFQLSDESIVHCQ